LTLPQEQKTQQWPGLGRRRAWQHPHSKKKRHASSGISSSLCAPQFGQVRTERVTTSTVFPSEYRGGTMNPFSNPLQPRSGGRAPGMTSSKKSGQVTEVSGFRLHHTIDRQLRRGSGPIAQSREVAIGSAGASWRLTLAFSGAPLAARPEQRVDRRPSSHAANLSTRRLLRLQEAERSSYATRCGRRRPAAEGQ
jgi:hypothetical protein